ncbi:hypothetical protein [Ruegeria profundi]|uniref:hypothetical protein n=1 Tax=Ruegeria profundi TaxID=1685378 RepID=UPI001CD462D9|nr:hypothetical protein [Ruegeria profundi]MCA0927144.1 hypothetical protein [Ruegeria profundi]
MFERKLQTFEVTLTFSISGTYARKFNGVWMDEILDQIDNECRGNGSFAAEQYESIEIRKVEFDASIRHPAFMEGQLRFKEGFEIGDNQYCDGAGEILEHHRKFAEEWQAGWRAAKLEAESKVKD